MFSSWPWTHEEKAQVSNVDVVYAVSQQLEVLAPLDQRVG